MANSLLNIQANPDNVIATAILKQFLNNLSRLLLHNLITVFPAQGSKTPTKPSSGAQGLQCAPTAAPLSALSKRRALLYLLRYSFIVVLYTGFKKHF